MIDQIDSHHIVGHRNDEHRRLLDGDVEHLDERRGDGSGPNLHFIHSIHRTLGIASETCTHKAKSNHKRTQQ